MSISLTAIGSYHERCGETYNEQMVEEYNGSTTQHSKSKNFLHDHSFHSLLLILY